MTFRYQITRRGASYCVVLLLLVHAALLAYAAMVNSVAFDEFAHLAAGMAYWKYRTWPIYNVSPPLLRLWAALPPFCAGASSGR